MTTIWSGREIASIPWPKLTIPQRKAVSLMLAGMSQRDAASVLGISRGALRKRLQYAELHLSRPEETTDGR